MMDWTKLSFSYTKTNTLLVCRYHNGKWSGIESCSNDTLQIHALSACLHYGLQCFEGMKAFNGVDGKVRIFRPDENADRLKRSADYIGIPCPDKELFIKMIKQAVQENLDFIPPYETKGSLYIRPTLIGTGPQLGLHPSCEAIFFVAVNPVGSYNGNRLEPVNALIVREYDRAAPNGSGSYKIGGNYAAAMLAATRAQKAGYNSVLYLDPKEHRYIDEFSSSNFFAIRGNSYITPASESVLPSITNKSLECLASDMGMTVERRKVAVEELASFEETGACGTAVVITPVWMIDDKPTLDSLECRRYTYQNVDHLGKNKCGPKSLKLYEQLTGIQYGEVEDTHGWCVLL